MTRNDNLPTFLALPERQAKPRTVGVTHVLDKGLPLPQLTALLANSATLIDIWKFGFGVAYLDPQLTRKVELLRSYEVKVCPGGTLTEIAWAQGKSEQYFAWLQSVGIDCVEVSNGATAMPLSEKRALVGRAAALGFEVFAEVGSKDPKAIARADEWVEEASMDLESGASWIVAEGRESGNVGLYTADGSVRADLVDALEIAGASAKVIYEAPLRAQQAWLIRYVGPNANLGNVATNEVLSLETLRLGLRSDTVSACEHSVIG